MVIFKVSYVIIYKSTISSGRETKFDFVAATSAKGKKLLDFAWLGIHETVPSTPTRNIYIYI